MKTRLSIVLLVLLFTITFSGCQQPQTQLYQADEPMAVKTSEPPAQEPKPASKPKPSLHTHELTWEENCSVEQAFDAAGRVLEEMGLAAQSGQTRTIRVRDPRTGRTVTKNVSTRPEGQSDGLSAILEARSTANIEFNITILLMPPESCQLNIRTTSSARPEDVLERQNLYLKQKISEAVRQELTQTDDMDQPSDYPKMMVFDRTVDQVYSVLYSWAGRENFEHGSSGRDRYYKVIECKAASEIQFIFTLRLIDANKTRLEIDASNYAEKDEFKVILQSLTKALEELKQDTPPAAATAPYPAVLILDGTVSQVSSALEEWTGQMQFDREQSYGDSLYRYVGCRTGSKIRISFIIRQTDDHTTRLDTTITNYEGKEEFPMILESLQKLLEEKFSFVDDSNATTIKFDKASSQSAEIQAWYKLLSLLNMEKEKA